MGEFWGLKVTQLPFPKEMSSNFTRQPWGRGSERVVTGGPFRLRLDRED